MGRSASDMLPVHTSAKEVMLSTAQKWSWDKGAGLIQACSKKKKKGFICSHSKKKQSNILTVWTDLVDKSEKWGQRLPLMHSSVNCENDVTQKRGGKTVQLNKWTAVSISKVEILDVGGLGETRWKPLCVVLSRRSTQHSQRNGGQSTDAIHGCGAHLLI